MDGKEYEASSVVIQCPLLNKIINEGSSTRAWVGRKYDGFYIGFKKKELKKLERLTLERFGMKPLKKLETKPK